MIRTKTFPHIEGAPCHYIGCDFVGRGARCYLKLTKHLKEEHHTNIYPTPNDYYGAICGFDNKLKWSPVLKEEERFQYSKYQLEEQIYEPGNFLYTVCPFPSCNSVFGCQTNLRRHVAEHKKSYQARHIDVESYSPFWLVLKVFVTQDIQKFTFQHVLHDGLAFRCTHNHNGQICNALLAIENNMRSHLDKVHAVQRSQRNKTNYIRGLLSPIFENFSDRVGIEVPETANIPPVRRNAQNPQVIESSSENENHQEDITWGLQENPRFEYESHEPLSEHVDYSEAGNSQLVDTPQTEDLRNNLSLRQDWSSRHMKFGRQNIATDAGREEADEPKSAPSEIQKEKDEEIEIVHQIHEESPKTEINQDRLEPERSQKREDHNEARRIQQPLVDEDQKDDQQISNDAASSEADGTGLEMKKEARRGLMSRWEIKHAQHAEIRIPRIRLMHHKKIRRGLKKLIENKLIPIIQECQPLDDSDEEQEFFNMSFEHVIYKLQRHIVKKLKIKPIQPQRRRKQGSNHNNPNSEVLPIDLRERMFELDKQESKSTTLAGKLRALYHAYNQTDHDISRANLIATLEMDALSIAQSLDQELINHTIGDATIESIRRVVRNADNDMENKLEWIHFYLMEKETALKEEWSKRKANQMQNLYMDDAKRAFKWLTDDTQPDISIPMDELQEHFRQIWEDKPSYTEPADESWWKLHKVISQEEADELLEDLKDQDGMLETIRSRGNASAPGADGLTNPILKIESDGISKLLIEMTSKMLQVRKCPNVWKTSRTILLYKGGERDQPGNWRPISLTSVLYRAIMARLTKCLFKVHQKTPIVSLNQKGFIPGIAGCAEHAAKANSIILNAARNNRTLFIVALDLKDAFGSIPHQVIRQNMRDVGIPEEITDFVSDTYHKAATRIFAGKSRSQEIRTNKGVKQGCPLSPLLFDLAIDPLLKAVETMHRDDGYRMQIGSETVSTPIQAYADDILLFSESKEGMDKILETVKLYGEYANIRLNPKKCKSYYKCGKYDEEGRPPENIQIYGEDLQYVNINEVIEYLGAPIGARKNAKLNFAEKNIEAFRKDLRRIMQSGLKVSQKMNAIKTFISPQLDFYLMNGQVKVEDVQGLDIEVRRIVNETLKGPPLPIDFFYTNWKDGGASMICLEERKEVMVLTNLAHLLCSIDRSTVNWFLNDISEEVLRRKISVTDYDQRFLNWMEDEDFQLEANGKRFDSLIFRAYTASKKLKVGFHYNKEENKVEVSDYFKSMRRDVPEEDEDESDVEEDIKPNKFLTNSKGVANSLMKILQIRHKKKLQSLVLRGHTFHSLQKSPCSNFFIGNCKAPTSDTIVRFAIRARTNSLPTRAILFKAGKVNDPSCLLCHAGHPETLNHVLNGCRNRMNKMTFRHNQICKILVQAVLKHRKKPIIKQNSTISFPNREAELPEDTRILKPDIWFETNGELYLIEVTVPYATKTTHTIPSEEEEGGEEVSEEMSTLEVRRREKVRKYSKLVSDCERVFSLKTNLFVIVISSLGAIPSETVKTVEKLLRCQNRTLSLWLKRMAVAAIRGSMVLFYNLKPRKIEYNMPTAIDEEPEEDDDEEGSGESRLQDDLHEQVLQEINDEGVDGEHAEGEGDQEADEEVRVLIEDNEVSSEPTQPRDLEEEIDDDEIQNTEEEEATEEFDQQPDESNDI
jgi:hypothetical protein